MSILRRWIKQTKGIGIGAVSIMLVLALVASACAPVAAAPAEKERVVKIGHLTALTGAMASTYVHANHGVTDYIRFVNEHGAGINETLMPKSSRDIVKFFKDEGIKLEVLWEDTQALLPRSLTAHKRFKHAGIVIELNCSSMPTVVLAPTYQRDEIPAVHVAHFLPEMITQPIQWVFAMVAGSGPEGVTFMKWVKDNWTQEHPPKIGYIIFDFSDAWIAVQEGKKHAAQVEIDWVGHEVVPAFGTIDTSVEWLRLAAKEPDAIYVYACGATLTTLVKDAARLGIREKVGILCSTAIGIDEVILRAMGEAAEGWYVIRPHPSTVETDLLGVKFASEVAKKYRGFEPEEVASHYRAGMLFMTLFAEWIKNAIQKVGHDNLTGATVRDAIVTTEGFETELVPPITVTDRWPYIISMGERIYQVREGIIWPVSDWLPFAYHYPELTERR